MSGLPRRPLLVAAFLTAFAGFGEPTSAQPAACLSAPDPAACLEVIPDGTIGLATAWMRLGQDAVGALDFEAAFLAFKAAAGSEPEAEGLALWAGHLSRESTHRLFPMQRMRMDARSVLRRDSLDAGALMILATQDVAELQRRHRRMAIPDGVTADAFSRFASNTGSGGGTRFSDRYRGSQVNTTVTSPPSESRLAVTTRRRLRQALGHPVVRPFALRQLARLHLVFDDLDGLADDAARFRRSDPDHPLGYLIGALAAQLDDRTEAAATLADMAIERAGAEDRDRMLDPRYVISTAAPEPSDRERWWQSRDPIALTQTNERLTEHIVRWAYVDLRFSDPYRGIRGADSNRGQVVLRYGIPDDEAQYTGGNTATGEEVGFDRYSVFSYPDFDFRFMDLGRADQWTFYSPSATAFQGSASVTGQARDDAILAIERFRDTPYRMEGNWEQEMAWTAAFIAEGGGVEVVFVGVAPEGMESADAGAMVLDEHARIVSRVGHAVRMPAGGETFSGTIPMGRTLATGLAARVEVVRPATLEGPARTVVFHSEPVDPPASAGLRVSSILLADLIEDRGDDRGGPGLIRKGLRILPSGDRTFAAGSPVYAYFEVYGLRRRADGSTDYEVTATLSPDNESGNRIARLFRRGDGSVSAGFRSSGALSDTGEYLILDPGSGAEGEYLLTLHLDDRIANRSVESTTRVRFR